MSTSQLRSQSTVFKLEVLPSPRPLGELGIFALDAIVTNQTLNFSLSLSRSPEVFSASLVVCSGDGIGKGDISELFSPSELVKYQGLKFEKRREDVRVGTFALKTAIKIAKKSNVQNSELSLSKDVFGRPFCETESGSVFLSLSHSNHFAVGYAGAPGHPVGIDIEKIETRGASTALDEMTAYEVQLFQSLDLGSEEWKTLNWSIKESYSKAIGVGLTTPFQILEVNEVTAFGGNYFVSKLKNFEQFYVHSWIKNGYAFSFAVPYKTVIHWVAA